MRGATASFLNGLWIYSIYEHAMLCWCAGLSRPKSTQYPTSYLHQPHRFHRQLPSFLFFSSPLLAPAGVGGVARRQVSSFLSRGRMKTLILCVKINSSEERKNVEIEDKHTSTTEENIDILFAIKIHLQLLAVHTLFLRIALNSKHALWFLSP